jgi:hypothetical protein
MHAGERQGLDEGPLSGRVGLTRGVGLILIAVVVGGLLLYRGVGPGPDVVAGSGPDSTLSSEGSVDDETAGPGTASTAATLSSSASLAIDDATSGSATDNTTTVTAAGDEPSDTVLDASTTSVATVSTTAGGPNGVTVLVLNAASEKGVAGKGTEILDGAGYTVLAPKNADVLGPSQILYTTSGGEAQARTVAEVFEVNPDDVVRAYNPSAPPIASIGDADVIVIIGTDGVIDVSGG